MKKQISKEEKDYWYLYELWRSITSFQVIMSAEMKAFEKWRQEAIKARESEEAYEAWLKKYFRNDDDDDDEPWYRKT
jgi:hypothetical protein